MRGDRRPAPQHARTQPRRPAIIAYDPAGNRTETTYSDLDERANRFAALFASRGIGRGGRIASMARNGVDVVAAYYGALKIGAAFTGVNPLYREAEVTTGSGTAGRHSSWPRTSSPPSPSLRASTR
ncbi:long-chain-fatty-acid--CoA ligase [Pseudonocardia sp. N23]|nr:long-chain-fatty-acid--CoA ligase [Pseudonocardia sp. N23]